VVAVTCCVFAVHVIVIVTVNVIAAAAAALVTGEALHTPVGASPRLHGLSGLHRSGCHCRNPLGPRNVCKLPPRTPEGHERALKSPAERLHLGLGGLQASLLGQPLLLGLLRHLRPHLTLDAVAEAPLKRLQPERLCTRNVVMSLALLALLQRSSPCLPSLPLHRRPRRR
jgi:hypothetical protein